MAISSLTYAPPIRRGERPPEPDYELLDAAVALAEEGKPLQSVTKVFEHLFPGQQIPELAVRPFSFTQGSSRVTVRVENGELLVTVPLVKLPTGAGAIAALRFVLTKISGSGQLYQPRLRGDVIILEFRDKLARMHPTKLIEVLRQMPFEADSNDDLLVGWFKAQPLARTPVEPVNDGEFARCAAIWRAHWGDVEELLKEAQRKRSLWFLNEVTAYAIYRISFTLPLCGFLGSRLSEQAELFCDDDEDPVKRESLLGRCVKEMKAVSAEELRQNLGHAVHAFSPLAEGTPPVLSDFFELGSDSYIDTIDELRRSGKTFDAALGLIGTYNFLLGRYYWPEEVEAEMKKGLELASGKPWREVAAVLFDHARALAAKYGGPGEDSDDEEDEEYDDNEDEEEDDA